MKKKPAIVVRGLSKRFSGKSVLDNAMLTIEEGDIFFLLGPNGSGKTTLINCLLSLVHPDKGEIIVLGSEHLEKAKIRTGIVLEVDGFFGDLSVEKNLQITALIKGEKPEVIPELLHKVDLYEHRNKRVRKLSQGMRKRLAIACSLVGNPDLLIWDEPYNGLDPEGHRFLRELIKALHENGKTLLISTHLLDEAKKSAKTVGILNSGSFREIIQVSDLNTRFDSIDEFYFSL
jgi:ABC-type multidrug transport system ATPase subunit